MVVCSYEVTPHWMGGAAYPVTAILNYYFSCWGVRFSVSVPLTVRKAAARQSRHSSQPKKGPLFLKSKEVKYKYMQQSGLNTQHLN